MIAAHIVTGFLGSGKTTLIAHLLRDPALADTAVVVNEFGAVGLDHALIEAADQEVVLLPGGCLCCALNGSLAATLDSLAARREAGILPPFRRVVIETTGLADPAPVLQAVLDQAAVLRGYQLGRVLTTVDAVVGASSLARHVEAVRQAAVADILLMTKTDLVGCPTTLRNLLAELNPQATVHSVLHGDAPVSLLVDDPAPARPRGSRRVADAGHAARIASTVVSLPEPVGFDALAAWLGHLAVTYGPQLLRIKGLVAVQGHKRPLLVQAVQHVFHPPRLLAAWPAGTASSLVFILDGLDPDLIQDAAFAAGLVRRSAA